MAEVTAYVGAHGNLNGNTDVVMVGPPNTGETFIVRSITVHNKDTASVRLEIGVEETVAGHYRIIKQTLQPGDTFEFGEDGETFVVTPQNDLGMYALLAAAPATTQPTYDVSWFQYDDTIGAANIVFTGTTEVELVPSPATSGDAGNARVIRNLLIRNRDTATATITLSVKNGATLYRKAVVSLGEDEMFQFGENTGTIILMEGDSLVAVLAGAPVTDQPQAHVNWREEPQAAPP